MEKTKKTIFYRQCFLLSRNTIHSRTRTLRGSRKRKKKHKLANQCAEGHREWHRKEEHKTRDNKNPPKQKANCQVARWIYEKDCFESKRPDKDSALEWQFAVCSVMWSHNVTARLCISHQMQRGVCVCVCACACVCMPFMSAALVDRKLPLARRRTDPRVTLHLSGGAVSLRQLEWNATLHHLQLETFNFQLLLGAEFCSGGSMQNDWKIANVIYIKVRLEEPNYAGDSRQYS